MMDLHLYLQCRYDFIILNDYDEFESIRGNVCASACFVIKTEKNEALLKNNILYLPKNCEEFLCDHGFKRGEFDSFYFSCVLLIALLEAYPLSLNKKIRSLFTGSILSNEKNEDSPSNNIRGYSVLVPMGTDEHVYEVKDFIDSKNIIGFYDSKKNSFRSFDDRKLPLKSFDNLIVVNNGATTETNQVFLRQFKKNIYFLSDLIRSEYEMPIAHKKKVIDTPIVLIGGIFPNCSKMLCQIKICRYFEQMGYRVFSECNSQWGAFLGIDVIKYTDSVVFPDDVLSINNRISLSCKNSDICILNVGGGLFYLNHVNANSYGAVLDAYLRSLPVDIFILCINAYIEYGLLEYALSYLKFHGLNNIIIVVSDQSVETSTLERDSGYSFYHVDKNKFSKYFNDLKQQFGDYLFVSVEDVRKDALSKRVWEILT